MIFFYENFYLKDNIELTDESGYVGYAGESTEFNSSVVFNEVNPDYMIEKTVDQLLNKGYLDIENKEYMRELFSDFKCYFIYSYIYEKYYLPIYFTLEELENTNDNFKNSLWIEEMFVRPIPELHKLDLPRYHAEPSLTKQKFGLYIILCTKDQLDSIQ